MEVFMKRLLKITFGTLAVLLMATACSDRDNNSNGVYDPYGGGIIGGPYSSQGYFGTLEVLAKSSYRDFLEENQVCFYCRELDNRINLEINLSNLGNQLANNTTQQFTGSIALNVVADNSYYGVPSVVRRLQSQSLFFAVNNNTAYESQNINWPGFFGSNGRSRIRIINNAQSNYIQADMIYRGEVIATGTLYR